MQENKICSRCKENKSVELFYKRSGAKGYHSLCKDCEKQSTKEWYENNKESALMKVKDWRKKNVDRIKQYRKENRYKHYLQEINRKYGATEEWFNTAMADQSGKCACCSIKFEFGNKDTTPNVDHCHSTLILRGLLCSRCNSMLGYCKDDVVILENLARYLRKWHG